MNPVLGVALSFTMSLNLPVNVCRIRRLATCSRMFRAYDSRTTISNKNKQGRYLRLAKQQVNNNKKESIYDWPYKEVSRRLVFSSPKRVPSLFLIIKEMICESNWKSKKNKWKMRSKKRENITPVPSFWVVYVTPCLASMSLLTNDGTLVFPSCCSKKKLRKNLKLLLNIEGGIRRRQMCRSMRKPNKTATLQLRLGQYQCHAPQGLFVEKLGSIFPIILLPNISWAVLMRLWIRISVIFSQHSSDFSDGSSNLWLGRRHFNTVNTGTPGFEGVKSSKGNSSTILFDVLAAWALTCQSELNS